MAIKFDHLTLLTSDLFDTMELIHDQGFTVAHTQDQEAALVGFSNNTYIEIVQPDTDEIDDKTFQLLKEHQLLVWSLSFTTDNHEKDFAVLGPALGYNHWETAPDGAKHWCESEGQTINHLAYFGVHVGVMERLSPSAATLVPTDHPNGALWIQDIALPVGFMPSRWNPLLQAQDGSNIQHTLVSVGTQPQWRLTMVNQSGDPAYLIF